jgi:hypothetical protein
MFQGVTKISLYNIYRGNLRKYLEQNISKKGFCCSVNTPTRRYIINDPMTLLRGCLTAGL